MTNTFKLERLDGTLADPPTLETTELVWNPGDRIPLGSRTLQVAHHYHDDSDGLPVLVVEGLGLKSV